MPASKLRTAVVSCTALAGMALSSPANAVLYVYQTPTFEGGYTSPASDESRDYPIHLLLDFDDYLPDGTTIFDSSNLNGWQLNIFGATTEQNVANTFIDFGGLEIENGQVRRWTIIFNGHKTTPDAATYFYAEIQWGMDEFVFSRTEMQNGALYQENFSGRNFGGGTWSTLEVPEPSAHGLFLGGLAMVGLSLDVVQRNFAHQ